MTNDAIEFGDLLLRQLTLTPNPADDLAKHLALISLSLKRPRWSAEIGRCAASARPGMKPRVGSRRKSSFDLNGKTLEMQKPVEPTANRFA
jgi:hypothetical protein